MRLESEVEPGPMLEHQRPFDSVRLTLDNDERCKEACDYEALFHLVRIPDLCVLRFECSSATGLCVDLLYQSTSNGFSRIDSFIVG